MRGGHPVGDAFTVNTYTTGNQDDPSVARTSRGEYLVVWESPGSTGDDTSGKSISARLFRDNSFVFRDGFESGSTTAWSDAAPEP